MNELMAHNPGVRSRFPTTILFEDYSVSELMQIARQFLGSQHLNLTDEASAMLEKQLGVMVDAKDVQNGNGRAVRNVVEQAMRAQALRLSDNKASLAPHLLSIIEAADLIA
uniref:CbbX AAA lid domain-containing protein n=1 Tax=Florenciella parvula TaxID=236787 RepID=A0A7S2C2N6_9STRA|mmetsp:Transcript_231/g.572  ORF Transcript_231/g.572 Transcript_231/m.572 type:complete len:111 (+) Transcript_231:3-335(+)